MKLNSPRFVIVNVMLQRRRWPVRAITGVFPRHSWLSEISI
jgi:hypothetical protein